MVRVEVWSHDWVGATQWKKFVVENIPIVRPDDLVIANFDRAMTDMLAMMDAGDSEGAEQVDSAIDSMVFDLYKLTHQETDMLKCSEN